MDAQENIVRPAIDTSPYNSRSFSSMLSPTTLPAEVVAEVFPIPVSRPSGSSTSTAAGSVPDGSGRCYDRPEAPIPYCESPFPRFCNGHCRTNNLFLQQLHIGGNGGKADVVRFLNCFLLNMHLIITCFRFVSLLPKIPNGLGKLHKDPLWLR